VIVDVANRYKVIVASLRIVLVCLITSVLGAAVPIANASTVSASINSYSPSSKIEVNPGQSFTISVVFTNTGDTAWDFLVGASIWDSNGNIAYDTGWCGPVRVQPGQQGSYSWSLSLSTPGEYWLQFGVWKDMNTLLAKKPSPSQNLIKVKPAADTTKPTVSSLSVTPSSVTLGSSFTISYSVSDSGGSGLNRVELWRANDSGGSPVSWGEVKRTSASGNSYSGSFTDAPSSVGFYWYGIHVVDNAGNWAPESSPVKVTVTAPTLYVSLEATPSSGTAPLNVSLKATVSGTATGTINYTFYSDRSDSGTNITSGWAAKFDGVTDNSKTAVLNYSSPGTYTAKVIVERGSAAPAEARVTITVSAAADTTKPTVSSLSVTPSSVTLGSSFTISYSVSDAGGSGLNRVELWRADDSGGSPVNWAEVKRTSASGNSYSGSFTDAPSSSGTYWYGIHAVDNAGNWAPEASPEYVEVLLLAEGPFISGISPTSGAPGIPVTIRGRNFSPHFLKPKVDFGSMPGWPFAEGTVISYNDTQVVVKVPLGEGIAMVSLSVDFRTSNQVPFSYNKPVIERLDPPFGVPGTKVIIEGENFGFRGDWPYDPHCYVKFGKSLGRIISWEDSKIVVEAPSDYGTGVDDVKFLTEIISYAVGGFWGKVIGILADLLIPGVALAPSEDGIQEDVIVATAAGRSNEVAFTWKMVVNVEASYLCSPGELRVYDSQHNVTGLVNGEVKEEIPHSYCYRNGVIIFYPTDSYTYEVVGTGEGSYGVTVTRVNEQESTLFSAIDIPTSANTVHQYIIDWDALSTGEKAVTMQIDSDGDGNFEEIKYLGQEGIGFPWFWVIVAGLSGLVGVLLGAFMVWRRMGKKQRAGI